MSVTRFKRIAFRVDASSQIGSGHVNRCLRLAMIFTRNNWQVIFICKQLSGNMIDHIRGTGFEVKSLKIKNNSLKGCSQEIDAEKTISAIGDEHIDLLIADNYSLDSTWENHFYELKIPVLVIDDLANRKHICNFLLDQNWFGDKTKNRYKGLLPENCVHMLGSNYALLDEKFKYARQKSKRQYTGEVKKVLVFSGGSDFTNLNKKFVECIINSEFKNIEFDVVLSKIQNDEDNIRTLSQRCSNIKIHYPLPSLFELMLDADLMMGAGGATTWERMCLGVPAIVCSVAENQIPLNECLEEHGLIKYLGPSESITVSVLRQKLNEILSKKKLLSSMSKHSQKLIDGQGLQRVYKLISSELKQH